MSPTDNLVCILRQRQALRERLRVSDDQLKQALRVWSDSRPGDRGGIATEAGASFILGKAGLL